MANKSKQAGNRFEKQVCDVFREAGWTANRLRSFLIEGEPDLYATTDGLLIEVQAKERQNLNVHKTLVDLIRAQGLIPGSDFATPAVVYKHVEKQGDSGRRMQEGPITITLPLDDFLTLVRMSSEGGVDVDRLAIKIAERLANS
jgi:hypothetical protein